MTQLGWIGVDFDGTLAKYDPMAPASHLGEPVPLMLKRVRKWLEQGKDVRIFTARVDGGQVAVSMGNKESMELFANVEAMRDLIQDWTEKHFGVRLPVTNSKDYGMIELWDDRAIRVEHNVGRPCCSHHRSSVKGRRK